jgi:predicted nucleic acid-binding protein
LLEGLVASEEDLGASECVRFELLAGVRQRELKALEAFFQSISWIPVDESITRAAGSMARQYRRSHSGIDDVDYLIGATALLLEGELLTTNIRRYPMLKGLQPAY